MQKYFRNFLEECETKRQRCKGYKNHKMQFVLYWWTLKCCIIISRTIFGFILATLSALSCRTLAFKQGRRACRHFGEQYSWQRILGCLWPALHFSGSHRQPHVYQRASTQIFHSDFSIVQTFNSNLKTNHYSWLDQTWCLERGHSSGKLYWKKFNTYSANGLAKII